MFRETTVRLTLIYLGIIMAISLFFSLSLYGVSAGEIERGVMRQTQAFEGRPRALLDGPSRDSLYLQRDDIIHDAQQRLAFRLLIVNVVIFIGGGLLSYALARRTLKPIEDAHEAQSRFVADASHELRTPITAMKTETEVALDDPKLTLSQTKKLLVSNVEELDKLTSLTDSLLRLARLDNNGHEEKPVKIDQLVQDSIDKVLPLAEAKKILINPDLKSKVVVLGDQHLLGEMLVTILDNAVKYSHEKTEIAVSLISSKQTAKIIVADHGAGIRAVDLPHIFERFYRSDSSRTKSDTNGYGLGLAIAKNIVDLHHGDITAVSKIGEGTTFTISLPSQ